MNKNKKLLTLLLMLSLVFSLSACSNNNQAEKTQSEEVTELHTEEEKEEVSEEEVSQETEEEKTEASSDEDNTLKLGAMTGPTGISAITLADNSENGKNEYTYDLTIVSSPDELVAGLAKEELDLAIIPANLASVLYNKPEMDIKVLSTNNLGVLYVLERGDSINSLEDLQGKEVLSAGKGTTPEMVIRNLLSKVEVETDENITFSKEASEVAQAIISGNSDIAILPEPMVTNVLLKADDVRIALNLNDEWEEYNPESKMVTAVLVGRSDVLENIDVDKVLEEYSLAIDMANNDVKATADLSEKYDLFPSAVAEKAIPNLNLVALQGDELKEALNGYLTVLYNQNPKSIGGELPGDDFYR